MHTLEFYLYPLVHTGSSSVFSKGTLFLSSFLPWQLEKLKPQHAQGTGTYWKTQDRRADTMTIAQA
jgi:hypothetical protein